MKKILIAIIFFNLMCACFVTNVNAAYAYSWTVNGEMLTMLNNSNKEGTAVWTSDEKYSGGVLTLNNYSGGQLKIDCYGTGLNHVFAVKLVGNNKIDVEKGMGIVANAPIVFIGDGTLTISAPIPIGDDDSTFDKNTHLGINFNELIYIMKTTIVIDPSATGSIDNVRMTSIHNNTSESSSTKENESTTKDTSSTKENESATKDTSSTKKVSTTKSCKQKDDKLFKIIVAVYFAISLITIIILIVKLVKKRKLEPNNTL